MGTQGQLETHLIKTLGFNPRPVTAGVRAGHLMSLQLVFFFSCHYQNLKMEEHKTLKTLPFSSRSSGKDWHKY